MLCVPVVCVLKTTPGWEKKDLFSSRLLWLPDDTIASPKTEMPFLYSISVLGRMPKLYGRFRLGILEQKREEAQNLWETFPVSRQMTAKKTRNIQLLLLCFRLFVERRSCSSFQWRNKDERHTFQKTGCKRSIVACLFLLGCINNHNDLFGILWMIVCLVKGHFALFPPPEFEMAIHILVGCLSCLFLWNWYIEVMS